MLVGCQGIIAAYRAGFVSFFPFDVVSSAKFVVATRRHRHQELPQQRQLIPVTRPLNTLRSLGDDDEIGYDYSNDSHHRKIVDDIINREGNRIPRIKFGQREPWTLVRGAKGGKGSNTARRGGARYSGRLGQGSRELQRRRVERGSRRISGTGSRMGGARDREGRGRGRSRPDAEAVSVGIQMGCSCLSVGTSKLSVNHFERVL